MDEKIKAAVKTLGQQSAQHADRHMEVAGELTALSCAVYALVRTHPDPVAFAIEMRQCWQQLGQPHASAERGPAYARGIESVLGLLEQSSSAPLHLRKPGEAIPPLQDH